MKDFFTGDYYIYRGTIESQENIKHPVKLRGWGYSIAFLCQGIRRKVKLRGWGYSIAFLCQGIRRKVKLRGWGYSPDHLIGDIPEEGQTPCRGAQCHDLLPISLKALFFGKNAVDSQNPVDFLRTYYYRNG